MLTIGIAADHPAVRDGLRMLLETTLICAVGDYAADTHAVVALAQRLRPDVLVIDRGPLDDAGLQVIGSVYRTQPRTRIVVVGLYASRADVGAALHAGALAYVLKETAAVELSTAIACAAAGQRYVSPALSTAIPVGEGSWSI